MSSSVCKGPLTPDSAVISDILNNYFHSVFTTEKPDSLPDFGSRTNVSCTIDLNFLSAILVQERLKKLIETKSKGYDDIHPRVLRNCASAFAIPLAMIYQKSICDSLVPELWKRPNVTPIFKQGSKQNRANYRPVSLTSVPCKNIEGIIHEQIINHCLSTNLISKEQHGFLQSKGCTSYLLETLDILTEAMHQGCATDIIFTDFAKAFDKVPHVRLLHKLKAY
jgi:hypothetical protein